ncbi:MAG TPA: hypothetical protein VJN64_00585 [Terriglobales bacterium]|nr:hypothetical protein [Terriglobales bacterium]
MCARPVNLLVFREDYKQVHSQFVKAELLRACDDDILSALLLAGEIECGVADVAPELACAWQPLTDAFAGALVSGAASFDAERVRFLIESLSLPEILTISPPEGFAYYALHPLAYADVLNVLGDLPPEVAVVGIRSIGTTMSAITSLAVQKRRLRSARITVRPQGHPYNRQTQFTPEQLAWIAEKGRAGAAFLVVDEGPGLSGSSLISTAEALVAAGVPASAITLICGHQPDFDSLRAENASNRAQMFRWIAVNPEPYQPAAAQKFIGGGEWRRLLYREEAHWPASWTSFERLKYLTSGNGDAPSLLKFVGFGHHGNKVVTRERVVAEAGFGPATRYEDRGFAKFPWISGRPMQPEDLSESTLTRLAEYCAFRACTFPAQIQRITPLQQMADHNLHELKLDLPVSLRLKHPVIADARMQPHEWLLTGQGQMLKTDSGTHGNDHFFPGPTDIAWDLAGTIVEWRMPPDEQEFFITSYQHASGDDPRPRLSNYIIAYVAFRCGYCTMAANASDGGEQVRLEQAAARYRAWLGRSREAAAV